MNASSNPEVAHMWNNEQCLLEKVQGTRGPRTEPGFSKTKTGGMFYAMNEDVGLFSLTGLEGSRKASVVGPGNGKQGGRDDWAVAVDDQSVSLRD